MVVPGSTVRLAQLVGLLVLAPFMRAHVGSPDVFLDAQAGPYKLFITIRPPVVIPGVAEVEVRAESPGVHEIQAVPVPLTKAGTRFAPVADTLKVSAQDPQFFTGSLWMMASGSWQVRLRAAGSEGIGVVAVPVPSIALTTKPMQSTLAAALFFLMLLLMAGLVLMVGASVREARLAPGLKPDAQAKRRARIAMVITSIVVFVVIALGHRWWKNEEQNYGRKVYKPLEMAASLSSNGTLTLNMANPEWMNQPFRRASPNGLPLFSRMMDDLVPDHDHLMHLYAIRQPGMDAVYHLHPELVQTGLFRLQLPSMSPGMYRLYADVVHANGFAETMVSQAEIPAGLPGRALSGDDAEGSAPAWKPRSETSRFTLPDGYVMEWLRPAATLHARTGMPMRFRLLDRVGQPAEDMQFYMGMLGHSAFVKTDGSTFAHVHPNGSVAMAAYMMAESQIESAPQMSSMAMSEKERPGMKMPETQPDALPNEVTFPYGFPRRGQYRIFVQMKHADVVETGVFDALVDQ